MNAEIHVASGAPLAEVTRHDGTRERVESVHHGHVVVVGPDGVEGHAGTPDLELFVRSTAKPFQAVACLELLDAHGPVPSEELTDAEVAVAWASHRGQQSHLATVRRLLARSGTAPEGLTCPPALAEADTVWPPTSPGQPPARIRHECSGKHALFALTGRGLGVRGPALLAPEGPLQRHLLAATEAAIGPRLGLGTDGCGSPVIVATLAGLARGYRALVTDPRWARAARAGLAHPQLVGGSGRVESALLAAGVVAKYGAEGVYCAGWTDPDGSTHGVAVKAADGSTRGGGVALVALLAARGVVPPDVWQPPAITGGGTTVGTVRSTVELHPGG